MGMWNQVKTALLLGALTGIVLWIGSFWSQTGLIIALVFVVLLNFAAYFFSDKIALGIYHAKPVTENEQPKLYGIVREVAHLAHVPMPKVYVIPSESPNAFATGRNPKHAAVAATHGIMNLLTHDELKGVIAHEIAHIKNRDILIQSVAATIAGVITFVATMARWGALFGGFGGRDGDSSGLIEFLAIAILAPILAVILQLALSRNREYQADATGAKFIHNPHVLADALHKLDTSIKKHPMGTGSASTAHMFIANPFRLKNIFAILSTHPPMEKRIQKLREMRLS
ncbi:zinc metalloprotease HtpX [Nanoarchaeota archaeon]